MSEQSEPRDFNALVTWATWQVIEGVTKGEALRSVLYRVLVYARVWQATPQEKP